MPNDKSQTSTSEPSGSKFSFSLLHQAGKGRFSTARAPGAAAPVAAMAAVGQVTEAPELSQQKSVDVRYKNSRATQQQNGVDGDNLPPLEHNRIDVDSPHFFTATAARRELLITASAAKQLTRLFAALTLEPGSGNEVPAHIRTQVLSNLIKESHLLSDAICHSIMEKGRNPPTYLRAKLLQQASEFLSEQWTRHGVIDTSGLKEIAHQAFTGNVDGLNQDVVDLFHHAGEYTPATDQELSQSRVTEAVVRASWSILRQVNHFDLSDYDLEIGNSEGLRPFSYGRDPFQVAKDLCTVALKITKENEIEIDQLDLYTTWTQNSIDRSAALVRAEYRMHTDRALRSSFRENLMSEAAIHHVNDLYPQILDRIAKRARNGFIQVERNAIETMSATAYQHYLPKRDSNSTVQATQTETSSIESADQSSSISNTSTLTDTVSQPLPAAKASTSRFSFRP